VRWSWRVGQIAGIGVYVHATFLLLIAWVAMSHWFASQSLGAAVAGAGFILALFACVVLHELGHALTARRYGVNTRDITLLPIGGVARLERIPEVPRQEALIALAGPAVNLAIVGVLAVCLWIQRGWLPLEKLSVTSGPFLERLLVVNGFLAGFNLLPAFPMDGGRVLRAGLATRMPYTRATEIAAGVGQGMALLFGLAELFGNPFLVFIAFFVWLGAAGEASLAQMRAAFQGLPVHRAMVRDFHILAPDDPLDRAVQLTLAGSQEDFPVVETLRGVGILRQGDLITGLQQAGRDAPTERFMCRDFEPVESSELLEAVFGRLEGRECHTVGHTLGTVRVVAENNGRLASQAVEPPTRARCAFGAVGKASCTSGSQSTTGDDEVCTSTFTRSNAFAPRPAMPLGQPTSGAFTRPGGCPPLRLPTPVRRTRSLGHRGRRSPVSLRPAQPPSRPTATER
jgi:Zn-dependent protease